MYFTYFCVFFVSPSTLTMIHLGITQCSTIWKSLGSVRHLYVAVYRYYNYCSHGFVLINLFYFVQCCHSLGFLQKSWLMNSDFTHPGFTKPRTSQFPVLNKTALFKRSWAGLALAKML